VGKTTSTANLGVSWALAGQRVLLVDFDPQFTLTVALGIDPSEVDATVDTAIAGQVPVGDAIVETASGVDLLPSRRDLRNVEVTLVAQTKREEFLADALADVADRYDTILVDCPPNLGLLTVNALFAVREVVVPVDMTNAGALQAAAEVIATVRELAQRGVDVRIAALIRTMVDARRVSYKTLDPSLEQLHVPVAETEIPLRAEFTNAELQRTPLVLAAPDSDGARAYRHLADELSETNILKAVA